MNSTENAIDKIALLNRCLGAADFAQSIVNQFLENWDRDYRKLESCIQQVVNDRVTVDLVRETHRLKGTAATIGANVLAQEFLEMENIAMSDDSARLQEQLARIQQEIERVAEFAATNL